MQNNIADPVFDADGNPVWVAGQVGILQASRGIDGKRTQGFELEASGELHPGWNVAAGWSRYQLEDGDGSAAASTGSHRVTPSSTRRTAAPISTRATCCC